MKNILNIIKINYFNPVWNFRRSMINFYFGGTKLSVNSLEYIQIVDYISEGYKAPQ